MHQMMPSHDKDKKAEASSSLTTQLESVAQFSPQKKEREQRAWTRNWVCRTIILLLLSQQGLPHRVKTAIVAIEVCCYSQVYCENSRI